MPKGIYNRKTDVEPEEVNIDSTKPVEAALEEVKQPIEVNETAKIEDKAEYVCGASHPDLPGYNHKRVFKNKVDAEAWVKRYNGKFL